MLIECKITKKHCEKSPVKCGNFHIFFKPPLKEKSRNLRAQDLLFSGRNCHLKKVWEHCSPTPRTNWVKVGNQKQLMIKMFFCKLMKLLIYTAETLFSKVKNPKVKICQSFASPIYLTLIMTTT